MSFIVVRMGESALAKGHIAEARSAEFDGFMPVEDSTYATGPLAETPDALHLACAIELGCAALASGDRRLLAAAAARGLRVHSFVV